MINKGDAQTLKINSAIIIIIIIIYTTSHKDHLIVKLIVNFRY